MTISKKKHIIFLFLLLPLPLPAQSPGSFPGSSEPGVDKTVTITFVVILFVIIFFAIFSSCMRRCYDVRSGNPPVDIEGGNSMTWRSSRGLDPTFISTFPTFIYSTVKGHKIGENSLECAVCLNEFDSSDMLRLIPKCSHVFHSVCIDSWLVSHSTCPVCRANLIPKPGDVMLSMIDFYPSIGSEEAVIRQHENHVPISVSGEGEGEGVMDGNVVNSSPTANRTVPVRSRSTGWRLSGIFQRSISTGNERFTLRLPEEVRSQLMNSTLTRTQSLVKLPEDRNGTVENGLRSGKNPLARTLSVPTPVSGRTGGGGIREEEEEDFGERSFVRLRPSGIGPSTVA